MIEKSKLKKIFAGLKSSPGIYKMIDKDGKVIYIGKAKDLGKRVKQYFQKNYQHSTRTKKLLEKVENIEWITVDSELEAMILENNLIKQFLPKYNVIMKDDKNYVYVKITKNENFPRIQIVRKVQKDGAKYIGPKTAANKVNETFKILKKIFPFRHCGLNIDLIKENKTGEHEVKISNKVIKYPCLDYFIKRCAAPCIGKISKKEYTEIIENVERFLEGKEENIVKDLTAKMMKAASGKKFERASQIRDQIGKIKQILEKQKISDPNQEDKDIINYCVNSERAFFNLFQIRDGKLIGQENFIFNAIDMEDSTQGNDVLEPFLSQYYELATDIPKEILIPHEIEDQKETEDFIAKQSGHKAKIIIPRIGDKNKLLEMSLKNAQIYADRNRARWKEENVNTKNAAEELQKLLKLKEPLKRIECYDISHLNGTDTVGSMIVFENGVPSNNMYRKFKLRTMEDKPDDYKSMEEVLIRRFSKIAEEFKNKDYIFKKAPKKYQKTIEKTIAKEDLRRGLDYKQFYILEKNKKSLAGFAALSEHSDKVAEINALSVMPKERGNKIGQKLLKNIIAKAKAKRVYIICKQALKDYYLTVGFEEIKAIPEEMQSHYKRCIEWCSSSIILAYDKLKHKPDESFNKIPNLIIIDGGKGQLSIAMKILTNLKLNIPCISLAKQLEEIYTPQSKTPILLERNNEALKLLQRARDEAHRFAITYNKLLRSKKISA